MYFLVFIDLSRDDMLLKSAITSLALMCFVAEKCSRFVVPVLPRTCQVSQTAKKKKKCNYTGFHLQTRKITKIATEGIALNALNGYTQRLFLTHSRAIPTLYSIITPPHLMVVLVNGTA